MHALEREEELLRRAVSRGDFDAVALSAARYAKLVEAGLQKLSPAEAQARLRRACSVLDWGRRNLRAARARIAEKLDRLQGISYYRAAIPVPEIPVHTWNIDA